MEMNQMEGQKPQGKGSMVGVVIILVILIAGGIYLFSKKNAQAPATPDSPEQATEEVSSIETDLNAANADLGSINADLDAMQKESSGL